MEGELHLLITGPGEVSELPEEEAMDTEPLDADGKEDTSEMPDTLGATGDPDPAADPTKTAEETRATTQAISFLPRNKEELERTVQAVHTALTGDILPRLHKCLSATVMTTQCRGCGLPVGGCHVAGSWAAPTPDSREADCRW